MTTAIGSNFGSTFASPGAIQPRGGTQQEVQAEELRRTTDALNAADTEEAQTNTFQARGGQEDTFAQPTDDQVAQARQAGQTRGSFLDIRA